MGSILIIDDDENFRATLEEMLGAPRPLPSRSSLRPRRPQTSREAFRLVKESPTMHPKDSTTDNGSTGGRCATPDVQPLQSADIDALAQVAGGVASALDDLLTVITGRASLLLDAAETDAPTRESLLQIYTAGEKAVTLIRQMLLFSGRQRLQAQVLDLNALIEESRTVLRRLLGDAIAVDFRLPPGLPFVPADASMVEHILLGLAANARDAMPSGGRLVVETAAVTLTEADAKNFPEGRPGRFIVLSLADTGCGIAPEILPHIFEPFCTTRAAAGGAGLGLATISGVVRQHQGWVAVDSKVGAGSEFKIFLPAAEAGLPAELPVRAGARDGGGHEAILLVEDDIPVREFTAAMLQDQGYRVLQAGTVADALEAWKWHGARVRVLLTDMVLEGQTSGLQLAAKLRTENPSLKVICTSGHQRDDMARYPGLSGGYQFLPKPCRPQTLMTAVRALLADHSP